MLKPYALVVDKAVFGSPTLDPRLGLKKLEIAAVHDEAQGPVAAKILHFVDSTANYKNVATEVMSGGFVQYLNLIRNVRVFQL